MSDEICVQFEVRSMLIMKDTLDKLGLAYQELKGDILSIRRLYHNIKINGQTGKISYDEMDKSEIDSICQNYMVNWYKDKAIREGNEIREETNVKGEVIIHVIR